MNNAIQFFIEMLIASTLLFGGYILLKKNSSPTFKRYYLLGWIGCSILFPLISIETENAPITSVSTFIYQDNKQVFSQLSVQDVRLPVLTTNSIAEKPIESLQPTSFNWQSLALICYSLIAVFFLLRIIISYYQIIKLRSNAAEVMVEDNLCYEVQDNRFNGASFFNWIFIGKSIDDGRAIVVRHELSHSKLFHSVDVLISHMYGAIFWINPFAWFLKREIAINCELEADAHLITSEDKNHYANLLFDLSSKSLSTSIANHFSAFHLKSRIHAISNPAKHKKWVSFLFGFVLLSAFVIVSCSKVGTSEIGRIEKMNDVKSITTRFTSHQSDTQQKTGKIVAIATFLPNGELDEFVEQTTYPYDFEFEKKKVFWEQPDKEMVPYIMDGLALGRAEKNFLYGSDWPAAYARDLVKKNEKGVGDFPWREIIKVDNDQFPTRIDRSKVIDNVYADFKMPDVAEFFEYEEGKIKRVFAQNVYHEPKHNDEKREKLRELLKKNRTEEETDILEKMGLGSGEKTLSELYNYENDRLASLKTGEYEYKFYYESDLLVKSEYFKGQTLLNTRFHFYEKNLKDRTEIINRYNELEYTISYEYEFWDN